MPLCITNFFKCNMNIDKFQLYYYTTLKEVAVINFVNTNNLTISFHRGPDNKLTIISAIDNLIKGAAGQAVQNMNVMLGFNETEALK